MTRPVEVVPSPPIACTGRQEDLPRDEFRMPSEMAPWSNDEMGTVLPLRGLWRAGLIDHQCFAALREAGVGDLPQLSAWTRRDLRERTDLPPSAVADLEDLMARYCLSLKADRRRRFRRPGRRLDPY